MASILSVGETQRGYSNYSPIGLPEIPGVSKLFNPPQIDFFTDAKAGTLGEISKKNILDNPTIEE